MKTKIAEYYRDNLSSLLKIAGNKVDNPSDIEEVVSEAAITLLRQVDKGKLIKEEDIPRFFTTAINSRSIDFIRKVGRSGLVDNELESGITFDQQFDEGLTPEEVLEFEQNEKGVELLIERVVNKTKRAILTKRVLHNSSPDKIAKDVGVSVQYVNRVVQEFTTD